MAVFLHTKILVRHKYTKNNEKFYIGMNSIENLARFAIIQIR